MLVPYCTSINDNLQWTTWHRFLVKASQLTQQTWRGMRSYLEMLNLYTPNTAFQSWSSAFIVITARLIVAEKESLVLQETRQMIWIEKFNVAKQKHHLSLSILWFRFGIACAWPNARSCNSALHSQSFAGVADETVILPKVSAVWEVYLWLVWKACSCPDKLTLSETQEHVCPQSNCWRGAAAGLKHPGAIFFFL